jgi:drug/metabolite transporter (DMT)-like permease
LAGFIALAGVLFVARPAALFGSDVENPNSDGPLGKNNSITTFIVNSSQALEPVDSPSSTQRTLAILGAILGTIGAAVAYSTIRLIGKRAHSLVSVNYFAFLATTGSAFIILVHPDLHFVFPEGWLQWYV